MSDILQDIADAASALCDGKEHSEPRWEWDRNRNKKPLEPHKTIVPGLIQQLRDNQEPGGSGDSGGSGGPDTVPVALTAVSLLQSIEYGSRFRASAWGVAPGQRRQAEDFVRGLVGASPSRPSDDQFELRSELTSWMYQAEIICGWRLPPRELPAPCPLCDARGTLMAYPDAENPKARCVGCGSRWAEVPNPRFSEGSIRILAEHVIAYERMTLAERRVSRSSAVAARLRREGKSVA